jgi:hypothetical protein
MKVPLKISLPTVIGLVSATLMVWDLHNQRVIMSMGMAWDTGAPLWPYQTPRHAIIRSQHSRISHLCPEFKLF